MAETAPKKMTEEQLGALFDGEFGSAQGLPGGDIAQERATLMNYYLQKFFGTEVEGESTIVTSDVADIVDGIMPSLLRIFTTADNLVSFDPVGVEDIPKAAQESEYVNYVFFKKNPAFLILFAWFFDALVQKNGIVQAWADKKEEISQETYENLTDADLKQLLRDPELEPVKRAERDVSVMAEDGVTPVTIKTHDIVFRRVKKYACIRVENVPPNEYRISADATSLDPSTARFVGRERDLTRSELVAMGFKKDVVYALPSVGNDATSSAEKAARNDKSDDSQPGDPDTSQEKVRVRDGFLKVDFDGDGRSELRKILKAGDQVLENEIADRQHFHVISPWPTPHKHFGRATAEKGLDIQRVTSELVRQTHTNLYHVNKPSHAVWEQGIGENTLDDLLTNRIGSIKRFARPVGESYQTLTVPFTAQASFGMIEYWNKIKRDRTGVSADSEGLSPDALKNIQQGVLMPALDIARMKIEMIARIFAETGVKSLFLHIHELLQKHQNKKLVVELRNEWVEIDPAAWQKRTDMTVSIGLGNGNREQNRANLDAIWNKQKEIVAAGGWGTLVTPMNVFNTAAEFVRNGGFKNPKLFFTPTDKVAPPSDEQAALMKQQQQLEARQQQLDAERQTIAANKLKLQAQEQMLEAREAQFNMMKTMEELKLERDELKAKVEKDRADTRVDVEALRNQVLELELKYGKSATAQAAAQ